jgi:DNA-binding transcriptional ArsR family regulator
VGVFEAIGDPARRRLLELLADGEQSVGTLVTALAVSHPVSQPAVSQHLRVLRDAGLVRVRPEGTRRLYSLDRAGLEPALSWLAGLVEGAAPFTQPLDALATEVARGRRTTRSAQRPSSAGRAAG